VSIRKSTSQAEAPENPARSSDITAERKWIGNSAKHLLDITKGTLANSPYYRLGVLGFSNVDNVYEWSTFDGLNANMMLYKSARLGKPSNTIIVTGVFTDQGLIDEQTAGQAIAMRTLFTIEDNDRHVVELYFTPLQRDEMLIDRSVYTRMQE
jgi:hypothetical protein